MVACARFRLRKGPDERGHRRQVVAITRAQPGRAPHGTFGPSAGFNFQDLTGTAGPSGRRDIMGRSLLFWLVGVPLPVVILLWLFMR